MLHATLRRVVPSTLINRIFALYAVTLTVLVMVGLGLFLRRRGRIARQDEAEGAAPTRLAVQGQLPAHLLDELLA